MTTPEARDRAEIDREEMKGRGLRVIQDDDLHGVSRPMDQQKVMPLEASMRAEALAA